MSNREELLNATAIKVVTYSDAIELRQLTAKKWAIITPCSVYLTSRGENAARKQAARLQAMMN